LQTCSKERRHHAKLPGWFTVPTPLGASKPDWAIVVNCGDGERLYFVVETKGGLLEKDLRSTATKIDVAVRMWKPSGAR
jgi:restriction endonuclease